MNAASAHPDCSISVRFHEPPAALQRYFTTFYTATLETPDGMRVDDALQPEWANLRFMAGDTPRTWFDADAVVAGTSFVATGPSSRSARFQIGSTRMWGIGLLPLGWARFVGVSADTCANLIADGFTYPAFARFVPFARALFGAQSDEATELARITAFFAAQPALDPLEEPLILAIHAALIDSATRTVRDLVEQVGAGQRRIERASLRHFGFPPKLLLRRQRFMRTLAQYMLAGSARWTDAIDEHYHDQPQFVRDCREFMGMTPREYAAMPHPVLGPFMRERARVHGAAVQTLDRPD